jgi:hypothetical protein
LTLLLAIRPVRTHGVLLLMIRPVRTHGVLLMMVHIWTST